MPLLQNHIAVITGAGSGIGRAIANGYAREGAGVVLLDMNEKAVADMGIIGDAKSASTEFGQQLLEEITDAAGGVFKQLLERQQLLRG